MLPVRLIQLSGKTEISLRKTRGFFVVGGRFATAGTAAGDFHEPNNTNASIASRNRRR